MRRNLALVAVTAAFALLLAGCGGGGSSGGAQPQPPAGQEQQGQQATAGDPGRGKQVYDTNCATCHGPKGEGVTGLGPNMASANGQPPVRERLSEADHLNTVRKGRPEKNMPTWEGVLQEQQILDVVAYERSLN